MHAMSINVTVNKCRERSNSQFQVSDYWAYLRPLNDGKTQINVRHTLSKMSIKHNLLSVEQITERERERELVPRGDSRGDDHNSNRGDIY
jgi:hypothetical protein